MTAMSGRLDAEGEPIIHRSSQILLASDVSFGGLNRGCPSRNWICSNSPPAAWHNLAHVLLSCRIRHNAEQF